LVGGVDNVAYYLPKALARKVDITYFPSFMSKKDYLKNFLNVYRKFVMNEFDIIHFNWAPIWTNGSYLLLRSAKKLGSHSVSNIHGIIPLEHKLEPAQGPIPYRVLSNALSSYKIADRIVVNSEYMRTKVVNWYGINRNKIVVIPNGVNLRMFSGRDDKLMLSGDPAILYLGYLSRGKGIDILFQAIAKLRLELPNMKLHLVGSGYTRNFQLLAKKREIEEFAVFHGGVPHLMVPSYYKSADICVFPSRHENFPISILEAMASGIPMIVSDIGVFREILSDGKNGMLFKSEDADALSKAILILYQDPDLRKKISWAALKTVAEYSWENVAEKYVSLYEYLCRSTSADN
jgi:glycosyltransferase involved in cell wall biosynthesis